MKQLSERDIGATQEFVKRNEIEAIAERLLFILGFRSNMLGTRYVKSGLIQYYENDSLPCRELYNMIASEHATTVQRVERNIRHAIYTSHAKGYIDRLNELFGFPILQKGYAPTNGEFISEICMWVHSLKSEKDV